MPNPSTAADSASDGTRALSRRGESEPVANVGRALTIADLKRDDLSGLTLHAWRLGERLGRGGMGQVFAAHHDRLGKKFAIKFIDLRVVGHPEAIQRFEHEAQALGRLDHPHVVSAVDAGVVDGIHFLVTTFVPGRNLSDVVKTHGPLPIDVACRIIAQVADGLQHVHERGLVHRDVKPSNIVVDDQGEARLIDFGLVRFVQGPATTDVAVTRELTTAGQFLGTCDYVAPEQIGDPRATDIRGDIYALGCTLHTLVFGEPPFAGEGYEHSTLKLQGHLVATPPRLRDRQSTLLPERVRDCLARMLAKRPEDRFQQPREIVAALAPRVSLQPGMTRLGRLGWFLPISAAIALLGFTTLVALTAASRRGRPHPAPNSPQLVATTEAFDGETETEADEAATPPVAANVDGPADTPAIRSQVGHARSARIQFPLRSGTMSTKSSAAKASFRHEEDSP